MLAAKVLLNHIRGSLAIRQFNGHECITNLTWSDVSIYKEIMKFCPLEIGTEYCKKPDQKEYDVSNIVLSFLSSPNII